MQKQLIEKCTGTEPISVDFAWLSEKWPFKRASSLKGNHQPDHQWICDSICNSHSSTDCQRLFVKIRIEPFVEWPAERFMFVEWFIGQIHWIQKDSLRWIEHFFVHNRGYQWIVLIYSWFTWLIFNKRKPTLNADLIEAIQPTNSKHKSTDDQAGDWAQDKVALKRTSTTVALKWMSTLQP